MARKNKAHSLIYNTPADHAMDVLLYGLAAVIILITLYPVFYTLALSFSGRSAVEGGRVWLFPVDFTPSSYLLLLEHRLLVRSYVNTVFYTVVGTAYSLFLTAMGGYVLSRRQLVGRGALMFMITFSMLFSGGLIPTFLVVNSLGLFDSLWVMIIPCAISQWNMIIVRTSMMAVSPSLEESAKIDGANHWQIFWKMYLPLSKAVIATIGLFYAVGKWNDYFTALIYMNNEDIFPVQLVIRSLLVGLDNMNTKNISSSSNIASYTPTTFKAAVVIVTMLPILCVYPFIQKYFVKGVMIGAVKG